ncbi:MAG: ABC transporter permease [Parabacteroides sp.]
MNQLIWKLLRQHISIGQLTGFFFANLFGMVIVLLSAQFYNDVIPIFTGNDSFMKKDYIIATKKISTFSSIAGKSNIFSSADINEMRHQSFTKSIGAFTPSLFNVSAGLGMQGNNIHLSTEMFFESVPNKFIDVDLKKWNFNEESHEIPIIIPRNYLDLYNFGFAQSRSLPKISEGLMGLIQLDIQIKKNRQVENYKGNIVGFSSRLNTILVPQSFMEWANKKFAPEKDPQPSRLIIEVRNPADASIAQYFQKKGYDTEDNKLDAGKTTYFLQLIVGIVLSVGLLISILSFYILMLSIFLLLEKNTTKLETLLLIGYSPTKVAFPYQMLTLGLNTVILVISIGSVSWLRSYYTGVLQQLFPQMETGSLWPTLIFGGLLFLTISVINTSAIHRKVISIWKHKS